MSLMAFDNPGVSPSADRLIATNSAEVVARREAAAKVGKDQDCTVTISVPIRSGIQQEKKCEARNDRGGDFRYRQGAG
jgi:hypothetical protein